MRRSIRAVLLLSALTGCAAHETRPDLYAQLGGERGLSAIVEGLITRVIDNPRIGDHFADTDLDNLHQQLVAQICHLAAGPCRYEGLSMQDAHSGQAITEADFNALVEDLIDSMREQQVPIAAQNQVLALLAPLRDQIIHR